MYSVHIAEYQTPYINFDIILHAIVRDARLCLVLSKSLTRKMIGLKATGNKGQEDARARQFDFVWVLYLKYLSS